MAGRLLLFCVCIGLIAHMHNAHNVTCDLQGRGGLPVSGIIILGVRGLKSLGTPALVWTSVALKFIKNWNPGAAPERYDAPEEGGRKKKAE